MRYKGLYTVFGVLAYCGALVLLAVSPWFVVALVAAALLGGADSVQMIPRNSAILTITPDPLRGRVEAFRSMLAGGGPPLGYTTSGALAAALGAPLALLLGAAAGVLLVVGVATTRRELRDPNLGSYSPESVKVLELDCPGPGRTGAHKPDPRRSDRTQRETDRGGGAFDPGRVVQRRVKS